MFPFSWPTPGRMQTCLFQNHLLGEHPTHNPLPLPVPRSPLSSLPQTSLKELTIHVSRFSSTPGNNCPDFYPRSLNRVMPNVILSSWFLLLDVVFWRFIRVVCVSASFHFIAEKDSLVFFRACQRHFLTIRHLFQYCVIPSRVWGVFTSCSCSWMTCLRFE